jgi:hypothetical protein
LWQVDFAKKHGLALPKLSPKKLVQEEAVEQKSTQYYAAKKAWQTIRKKQTKQAIIEFLARNSPSRNGAIWKHIQADKKTKVSLKMFNSYLAELVDEAQVTKTEEEKPGRKYPRYSLTPEAEREKRQIILDKQWIENIGIIIVELEKNAVKISPEILAQRMYFVYSLLNGLVRKQKIMQEFSDHKLLTNQSSYQSLRNFKKMIPHQRDHLFAILNNLPIKKGQEVLEKMIYLSEKDYVKILGEQGKTPSDLRDKMMADYARIQLPNADQPKRLIVDNFWDGWPDE